MRLLLINPPRLNEIVADNPAFIDEERGCNPPLGLLYCAASVLRARRHTAALIDAQAEQLGYDDALVNRIMAAHPDIVGITAMTPTLIDVVATIASVRAAAQRLKCAVPIIVGGPHAHLFPRETLALAGVDYVVLGEGEPVLPRLLDALETGAGLASIPGLGYRRDGTAQINPHGAPIEDLDALPFPARALAPVANYRSILSPGAVVTTMITSRGCPYACSFCDRPHLGKKFRARGPLNVVDEMEECARLGIGEILVYDDTFTVNRQRVVGICEEILRRKLPCAWDIRARVDTVDEDLLKLLRKAGCHRIHFGVESGSDAVLRTLRKGFTVAQVLAAFADAKEAGMETLAYFMIGSPGETARDIQTTIDLARRLDPAYAHITVLTPYPGTELYSRALSEGVAPGDYWREFARDPAPGVAVRYWEKELSREQLITCLHRFYRSFYGRPSYILRQLTRITSARQFMRTASMGLKILAGRSGHER